MRETVAQPLRVLDGRLPVRRMRMTWTVAVALAGYVTMVAVQLSLVAPLPGRAASAAPARPAPLLSISGAGVCVLPVCVLGQTCAAGVGGACVLPTATPPPVQPAPPVAPAPVPVAAAPAPVTPSRPAPAAPAPVVHPARHPSAAAVAPPPAAPSATPVIVPVARPVAAAAAPAAPVPASGVPLPAPVVVATPPTGAPAPAGIPWGLYLLFAAVDTAAAVALTLLIRRTATARSRG